MYKDRSNYQVCQILSKLFDGFDGGLGRGRDWSREKEKTNIQGTLFIKQIKSLYLLATVGHNRTIIKVHFVCIDAVMKANFWPKHAVVFCIIVL